MAPRATSIKEQGFSEAVAARIEAPQRGSTRSIYEAKWTIFTKWCVTNQVDFRAPPVKSVADFLMYLLKTGSYSLPPLMVTGQPLLINWEIHPLTSARTKILLVSWIVSIETDPKAGGESLTGTSGPAKAPFEPIKGSSLKHLTFKTVFLLALGSGSTEVRFMLGKTKILDYNQMVKGVPVSITQLSFQESAGQRGSRQCRPSGYTCPGPQLWIDSSSLTGPSFQLEHCATLWTGPQTSGRLRRCFLSPLRKVSTMTSHMPLSPLGSSRLWSYVMSCLTRRPTLYIRLKPLSGPLLRFSSRECP